jgi:hypothetical protein
VQKKRSLKKRKGRPRKSSQALSQGTESSFGSERSPDTPGPATQTKKNAKVDDTTITTPGASRRGNDVDMSNNNIFSGISTSGSGPLAVQKDRVIRPTSSNSGIIDDSILDDTSMGLGLPTTDDSVTMDRNVSYANKEEEGEAEDVAPAASEDVGQEAMDTEASSALNSTDTQSTFQSLKARMQSVIAGLGLAAFSRAQVNEMEDIFMDAKENLYGAGRRGRTERPE